MIKVQGADVEFMKFSAGEPHVKVTNINRKQVTLYWKFENFEEFMYVAMIADTLSGATNFIKLDMPYVPFARQDRATTVEQPFSLDVFCKMLKTLNIDSLTVSDVHSTVFYDLMEDSIFRVDDNIQFDCACDVLPAWKLLANETNYDCIIAPDSGAEDKAHIFSRILDIPLVFATKIRDPLTGMLCSPTINFKELRPRHALIPDDILDKGGTFIQLANEIKRHFPDIKLDLYVTHGIFASGINSFKGKFENIYCYSIMNKEITSGDLVDLSRLS